MRVAPSYSIVFRLICMMINHYLLFLCSFGVIFLMLIILGVLDIIDFPLPSVVQATMALTERQHIVTVWLSPRR